jgi:hypothetical protein
MKSINEIVAELRMGDDGGKPAYRIGRADKVEVSMPSGTPVRSYVIECVTIKELADWIEAAVARERGPVLFDFPPPSGRPFGIQVTRRQEGPDRGHGKRPASTQWGGVCTRKVVLAPGPSGESVGLRVCLRQRRRATSAPHARHLNR